jgi:hypothetical protein
VTPCPPVDVVGRSPVDPPGRTAGYSVARNGTRMASSAGRTGVSAGGSSTGASRLKLPVAVNGSAACPPTGWYGTA